LSQVLIKQRDLCTEFRQLELRQCVIQMSLDGAAGRATFYAAFINGVENTSTPEWNEHKIIYDNHTKRNLQKLAAIKRDDVDKMPGYISKFFFV